MAELNIHGIECDNTECDYEDPTANLEDYENWLNKPCPLCGSNLLTEDDMDAIRLIMSLVSMSNAFVDTLSEEEKAKTVSFRFEMDGTGVEGLKVTAVDP